MLVGVTMGPKNTLGNRFNQVAANMNLEINQTYFLANVVMLKRDYFLEFVKAIGETFN